MPTAWIQKPDFSSEEISEATPEELMVIFRKIDWAKHILERKKREQTGQEVCDSGFGIVFQEGEILHLIEPEAAPYRGFYHHQEKGKLLGVFPTSKD
ncbi:MAG: hypothetical protein AAGC74_09875, partial [Verrucomicrobiota bacterium]